MKTTETPFLLAVTLLASASTLHAQQLTPSGNSVVGNWTGWGITSVAPTAGVPGSSSGWRAGAETVGSSSILGASFLLDTGVNPGYQINPAWQGSFGITTTKQSGPDSSAAATSLLSYGYSWGAGPYETAMTSVVGNQVSVGSASFVGSGSGGGAGTVSYDFSTMSQGYLPAGTLFYISDIDLGPDEGPLTITSNLSTAFLDFVNQGDYSVGGSVALYPQVTFDGGTGTYSVNDTSAVAGNNSSDYSIFVTTENLTSLTVSSFISAAAGSHTFRLAAPLVPVPEPSGALLAGMAGGLALLRRRRR